MTARIEDDPALIERAQAGDGTAWSELVALYRPLIHVLARHTGLTGPDVEDVEGAVWEIAYTHLAHLREIGHFRAWLSTIAARESVHLRLARASETGLDELAELPAPDPFPAPDALDLRALLAHLPEREQAIMQAYLDNPYLSYQGLAEQAGIKAQSVGNTVKRTFRHARRELREWEYGTIDGLHIVGT